MAQCLIMQNLKLTSVFYVALGGSLGASSRYALGILLQQWMPYYPWGTLSVNVLGSFCAGILLGLSLFHAPPHSTWILFAMTGFLGSFTTFSAFGYEVHHLWWQSRRLAAMVHVLANLGGALVAVALGILCVALWLKAIGSAAS